MNDGYVIRKRFFCEKADLPAKNWFAYEKLHLPAKNWLACEKADLPAKNDLPVKNNHLSAKICTRSIDFYLILFIIKWLDLSIMYLVKFKGSKIEEADL